MEYYRHVLYLIEPRTDLAAWLHRRVKSDVTEELLKPVTYHTQEKEDAAWNEADRLLKAKLIFLHGLRESVQPLLHGDADYAAVFGSTDILDAHFDRWWTIRRYEAHQELGDLARGLPYTQEPASPTGSTRVDEWLAETRAQARRPVLIGSVLFHNPGELEISPLVHGSWERPILEILDALGPVGNDVFGACAELVAWCLSKNPRPANLSVLSIPGLPWPNSDDDRYEWYDRVMVEVASWKNPPYLVDLGKFLITYRDEVVWPPQKRGVPQPKDPRTTRPGSPFRWGWFGVGLGDLRPARGTYTCYSCESLPPILATLDGSFAWLESARNYTEPIGNREATQPALAPLLAENTAGLPIEFVRFFRSPTLWRKIRSCTGCGLSLDAASVPIPGGLGSLVRFMSDYQGCIHFSLHISPCGTKHTVVATYHFTGSEHGGKPHPRDTTTCAASFEEFIYRFWIENELWYALHDGGATPKHGDEYLACYRTAAPIICTAEELRKEKP